MQTTYYVFSVRGFGVELVDRSSFLRSCWLQGGRARASRTCFSFEGVRLNVTINPKFYYRSLNN